MSWECIRANTGGGVLYSAHLDALWGREKDKDGDKEQRKKVLLDQYHAAVIIVASTNSSLHKNWTPSSPTDFWPCHRTNRHAYNIAVGSAKLWDSRAMNTSTKRVALRRRLSRMSHCYCGGW